MADTNQSRRADASAFTDNDPFAELARIMGHEPSVPQAAEPARSHAFSAPSRVEPKAADDFDIDLEKELMGDLDFAEFDEPRNAHPEPMNDWRVSTAVAEPEPVRDWRAEQLADEPVAHQPSTEPVGFDGVGHEPFEATGDAATGNFDVDHSVEDLAASIMEEDLAEAIDLPMADEQPALIAEPPPVADHVSPTVDEAAVWTPHEASDQFMAPDPVNAPVDSPADEWMPRVAYEAPAAITASDLDFDTSFLDDDEVAPEAPVAVQQAAPEIEYDEAPALREIEYDDAPALRELASTAAFEPVAAAPAIDTAMSLEDELSALLSHADLEPKPAADMSAASAQRATASGFGRANFPRQTGPVAAAWQPAPVEEPVAHVAPVFEPQPEPRSQPMAAPAALEADDFSDIFADEHDDVPVKAPVHVAAMPAATAPVWQTSHADLPEVDTVEMIESAHPVVDDLDIPDIDFGALDQQPRMFDDLDGDFAQAFDDLVDDGDRSRPAAAAAAVNGASDGWNAASLDNWQEAPAVPADAQPEADAYAVGEGRWNAAEPGGGDGFDYDSELEEAIALSNFEEEAVSHARPRGRGFVVAAVVAAVAVIGGAGVLGMSFLGGGSDTPAFVRADTDPMKVRPENPGGTTVPNQDSEAYARVAGDTPSTAPAQETLITTAEEPLDVAAETAPPASAELAPGISEEGTGSALAPMPSDTAPATDTLTAATQPKGDDRIEPADEAEATGLADELAVVAPRKVRTMIVRPDGTMVPREEAAPAAEETVAAVAPLAAPEMAPVTAEDPAVAEDPGPTVDTPPTVAVVPSQRTEPAPSAPVAAAPAAPQPVTQTPAATPASAPAAAAPVVAGASEWSMQIASQPTAEGAQATYQDLARRYGSVLEGRGVNIVKADIAGKGTYYRVRIPSASRDEAINLCTRYKSAGGSCFVSR